MKVLDGLLVKSLGLVIETWDQIRPLHIKRGVSGLGVCVGVYLLNFRLWICGNVFWLLNYCSYPDQSDL